MPSRPDLVRVKLENGAEATIGAAHARNAGLTPLAKPAVDLLGRPLRVKHHIDLRGAALDEALEEAGLSKSGTADEKRQRLADHQMSGATVASADENTTIQAAESATSEEDS